MTAIEWIRNKKLKFIRSFALSYISYANMTDTATTDTAITLDVFLTLMGNNFVIAQDENGRSFLHYACQSEFLQPANVPSQLNLVKFLVAEGADVNVQDTDHKTPLHHICGSLNAPISIVELLISKGASVNAQDAFGRTPLHYACMVDQTLDTTLAIVKLLVHHDTDVNLLDDTGKTALEYLRNADVSVRVDRHAHAHVDPWMPMQSVVKMTQLHIICKNYEESMMPLVEAIIASGVDVNQPDLDTSSGKLTPLHIACKQSNPSLRLVKYLLDNGADVSKTDAFGKSALHFALHAKQNPSLSLIELLVNIRGVSVHYTDSCKSTPLHYACWFSRSLDLVQYLVSNGANIHAVDKCGQTPLHMACYGAYPSVAIVEFLVSKRADVFHMDEHSCTPLHVACKNGHGVLDVVKFLVSKGVRVEPGFYEKHSLDNAISSEVKALATSEYHTIQTPAPFPTLKAKAIPSGFKAIPSGFKSHGR